MSYATGLALLLLVPFSAAFNGEESAESCGNATLPLSSTKPNILLIGDSISMTPPFTPGGYGHALEVLLDGTYAVQHAGGDFSGGQAGDTRQGLICTNATESYFKTLGNAKFDLIHFNYGLHDLANYSAALPRLPVDQYARNLVTIYKRLTTYAKKVMWTTTTPVPNVPTSYGRSYELAVEYNAAALKALTAIVPAGEKLLVNDLWKDMIGKCGAYYKTCDLQLPANVHLAPAGIAFCAESAARDIKAALAA